MTEPEVTGAPATSRALVLTQKVVAPPETVYDFFVDPDKLVRWMGTAVDIDARPGGRFWLNVTGTDIASGSYLELDPPNRVVFSFGWEGSADVPPGSSIVTVSLTPVDDDTMVELRHDGLPSGPDDEHGKGWSHYLVRLVSAAAGHDPGPDSFNNS